MADNDDILIELNFVPAWARGTPRDSVRVKPDSGAAEERPVARRGGPPRGQGRHFQPARAMERRPERAADGMGRGAAAPRPAQRFEPARADVAVSFIPGRKGMAPLAHKLAKSGRAYPLMDLAAMFMSKPEYYAVRIEIAPKESEEPGAGALTELFQCAECGDIFIEQKRAVSHALAEHFESFYSIEESVCEPPKGNFPCVARCSLSGEILGPPNYHGFQDRVLELHRRRFSHMPLDEYRKHIVNENDPALVEKWRQQACRRTAYKTLRAREAQSFSRRTEVEEHFMRAHASDAVRRNTRFVIPGGVAVQMRDESLMAAVREAWNRESRFPLRMSLALRFELKRLGLKLFRTSGRAVFVSSIAPNPIKPESAVEGIGRVISHLMANPGCTRQELAAALLPGADAETLASSDVMRDAHWLKEKGHIVEFSDGRLAAPCGDAGRRREKTGHDSAGKEGAEKGEE